MQVLVPVSERDAEDGVTACTLLLRLEQVFPGMGFGEAIDSAQQLWLETDAQYRYAQHQALVDFLGERGICIDALTLSKLDIPLGALNEFTLTALHDAEVHHLNLGPTMSGVNKLNLPRGDVMRGMSLTSFFQSSIYPILAIVFSHPGWFKDLKTISFAGGRFRDDFDLACIQPLRQIERLVLGNTGVGNEVFA